MKKKVLFIAYGGGHVNALIPIIRTLSKDSGYSVEVLGLTTSAATLEREGIPYFGFRHIITDADELAHEWGEKLAKGTSHQSVSYAETVAYLGLSYQDLIDRLGEEEAARRYKNEGRQAFCPITVLGRLLKKIKPDLVFATNAPRAEKAAILCAGQMGVPAICLVDLFGMHEMEWIGQGGYANKVCVLSDFVKDLVTRGGRDPNDVVITGNPAFDRLADDGLQEKANKFRLQKNWENDRLILWASQPEFKQHHFTGAKGNPELPRQVDQVLIKALKNHPDWRLIIRPHPSEDLKNLKWPERVELCDSTTDLPVLLKASDVVITLTSTLGLEAALLGKPLITIDLSIYTDEVPFTKMGISLSIRNLDHLEDSIAETLKKNWTIKTKFPKIGSATSNVVKVIEEVLSPN